MESELEINEGEEEYNPIEVKMEDINFCHDVDDSEYRPIDDNSSFITIKDVNELKSSTGHGGRRGRYGDISTSGTISYFKSTLEKQILTKRPCEVCRGPAVGEHYGIFACEGCKAFFKRYMKGNRYSLKDCKSGGKRNCMDNADDQVYVGKYCQYCRQQKCLAVGMSPRKSRIHNKNFIDHQFGLANNGFDNSTFMEVNTYGEDNNKSEISVNPMEDVAEKYEDHLSCAVCGDIAIGEHYGTLACEGCKAFFKRYMKGQRFFKQDCKSRGNQNCMAAGKLPRQSRKACQYCRQQKCLKVGMSPNKSKLGRKRHSPLKSSSLVFYTCPICHVKLLKKNALSSHIKFKHKTHSIHDFKAEDYSVINVEVMDTDVDVRNPHLITEENSDITRDPAVNSDLSQLKQILTRDPLETSSLNLHRSKIVENNILRQQLIEGKSESMSHENDTKVKKFENNFEKFYNYMSAVKKSNEIDIKSEETTNYNDCSSIDIVNEIDSKIDILYNIKDMNGDEDAIIKQNPRLNRQLGYNDTEQVLEKSLPDIQRGNEDSNDQNFIANLDYKLKYEDAIKEVSSKDGSLRTLRLKLRKLKKRLKSVLSLNKAYIKEIAELKSGTSITKEVFLKERSTEQTK